MADVSGIGRTDFSVATTGPSTEENGRLNRPAREDARTEDATTTPQRGDAVQAERRTAEPSPLQNDGDGQRNTASTGDFTAGGTDSLGDTVSISAEARNALGRDRLGDPASAGQAGSPAEASVEQSGAQAAAVGSPAPQANRDSGAGTRAIAGAGEVARNNTTSAAGATPPAASANQVRETAEGDGPDRTNQSVRDENSNAEVSGGEADQSEQTRTIGQIVDVFA